MKRAGKFARLLADRAGISTAEFALVGPAALLMMIGGMYVAMLGFTAASLRYATEQSARCGAVNTTVCTNAAAIQTYAASQFRNLSGSAATFAATTETCGTQVTGSVSYTLKAATYSLTIPLAARACFP